MRVVIIGAGVVGVTSAYFLARAGHDVTVVDGASQISAGASHANGGQLSYSFTDPLAGPAFLKKIPRLILGIDPSVRIANPLSPALVKWGTSFLAQCTAGRARRNSKDAIELALRSASILRNMLSEVSLDFAFRRAGKLVLLRDQKSLDAAARSCSHKRELGCKIEVISLERATTLEPALADMPGPYSGAVYSEDDEVADARVFTQQLAKWLVDNANVTFRLEHTVQSIMVRNNQAEGVSCDANDVTGDAVVVCAGAGSQSLLQPVGLSANIYPVRGYSLSLPAAKSSTSVSLTDYDQKIVFSRLANHIRIAGFADFRGYSCSKDKQRIRQLHSMAQALAPHGADYRSTETAQWGGFRPMTPDGRPRVGPTSVKNLFLNTGHGMFGWTLACATGYDLCSHVSEYYSH